MKKRLTSIAGLVLLAGSLAACGGDDGGSAPTDASKDDFCGVFSDIDISDTSNAEEATQKAVDKLKEVGTPEDISDQARKGFEWLLDNSDATGEEATSNKDAQAFSEYFATTCAEQIQEQVQEQMGDSGADLEEQMGELEEQMGELTESP